MRTKNLLFSTALTLTMTAIGGFPNEALASVSATSDFIFYQNGTEDDYDFVMQDLGEDGKLTNKYYKINLDPQKLTKFGNNVTWSEVSAAGADTITVKLPNNQEKYFRYTYEQGDRTKETKKQDITGSNVKIDRDFINVSEKYTNGGAIRNKGTETEISGVFIGNSTTGTGSSQQFGGAVYNNAGASIVSIQGDFIGNSVSTVKGGHGGAIANYGTIGNKAILLTTAHL